MKTKFYTFLLMTGVALVTIIFASHTENEGTKVQRRNRKSLGSVEIIKTNPCGKGPNLAIEFTKGKAYKHPVIAIWAEDMNRIYLQDLYVSRSVATSVYRHGTQGWGHWKPAVRRRPATLPYWAHQRGVKAADGLFVPSPEQPVADAYSGATPLNNFALQTKADSDLPLKFRLLLEINVPFDWNQHWHNNRFPNDADYKTSGQPSVVYEAIVDRASQEKSFAFALIGTGHYAGSDGKLYNELSTLTTALDIDRNIRVILP